MRGYFDSEELDGEEPQEPGHERRRDTELTLGWGVLLTIVFGLVLVCGLSFWLGYTVGHHSSTSAPATAAPTAAPDQEPLQANESIPKPSADAQAPAPPDSPASDGTTPPAADGGANPATPSTPKAGQNSSPTSSPAAAPAPAAPTQAPAPVLPAIPAAGNGSHGGSPAVSPPAAAPPVRPALPGAADQFMVQVAAVSHADDASVLVNALRKRGYAANAQREPPDGLIHVRIGPFATHDEANRMCTRLLNDGYNAMVQP